MQDFGRFVVIVGIALIVIGLFISIFDKIPFLGKLPGDVLIKKGNFTFFAPIATSVVISLVITLILNLFLRFKK